ncbi:MAG: hypothetical protein GTO08_06695 [Deltaproteobacteria bacterium]|nr:hypothetical protein [Deltaproteobacteria bacterium]
MPKSNALEDVKKIILAWKESYLKLVRESGGGELLAKDYEGEIEEFAFPYIMTMFRNEIISEDEMREFMDFCHTQIKDFKKLAGEED